MLASGSPRRAELLSRLGVTALQRPTDIDETPLPHEPPDALVARLAAAKAEAGALAGSGDESPESNESDEGDQGNEGGQGNEIVLAADTIVVLDDHILGKPRDRFEARQMLTTLSGRTHEVITGLAVHHGEHRYADQVTTRVTFRDLAEADIDWYLGTGECDDKAGAYGLQGAGAVLIERIDGSDTNVIGLPLAQTVALLRRAGIDLLRRG